MFVQRDAHAIGLSRPSAGSRQHEARRSKDPVGARLLDTREESTLLGVIITYHARLSETSSQLIEHQKGIAEEWKGVGCEVTLCHEGQNQKSRKDRASRQPDVVLFQFLLGLFLSRALPLNDKA